MDDAQLFSGLDKRIKAALKSKRAADKRLQTIVADEQQSCQHEVVYKAPAKYLNALEVWLPSLYVCAKCGAYEEADFPSTLGKQSYSHQFPTITREQAYALRLGLNRSKKD